MNLSDTFRELKKRNEGALIAYITGGDPSVKHTQKIAEALFKGGTDILEIGIPFSDPIADGPIIQAASNRALKVGTTPERIFDIIKKTKKQIEIPIVILTYFNIIFKKGIKTFLEQANAASVDGIIVPDLPIEEANDYKNIAKKMGINTIFLATPSTSLNRLKDILEYTSGFLYLVSLFGVTGIRKNIAELTTHTIKKFKPHMLNSVPMAVGFGISKPEHVSKIINCGAEGTIVGSAFVKIIESNLQNSSKLLNQINLLAKELKSSTIKKTK
ncbi:MAG: tryptophan synthase subunit alpha [Candidatus Bathyarchaeota archaeon]|nr:tryptophan synthase subunit alpha [Candidatus Bathyarchaeota archaeon]